MEHPCLRCHQTISVENGFFGEVTCPRCNAAFFVGERAPTSKEVIDIMLRQGASDPEIAQAKEIFNKYSNMNINRSLKGIGGWLILPGIGIIVGAIFYALRIALFLSTFRRQEHAYSLTSSMIDTALLVYLIVIAFQFFRRKRVAPKNIIIFTALSLVPSLGMAIMGFTGSSDMLPIIVQCIFSVIWIFYFVVSKRVKLTFIN